MNPSNSFIWKAARDNVPGYPACFPEMNEAQMARLAFDPHCYECYRPNCRTVDWRLLVRLCSKCKTTHLVDQPWTGLDGNPGQSLALFRTAKHCNLISFRGEIDHITAHWATLKTEEEKESYRKERHAFRNAVDQHAMACEDWFELQRLDRSEEIQQARDDRKASITEKLTELGWGSEIGKIPCHPSEEAFPNHRLVKPATRLTPRIWKNIQPEMIKYMEQMKSNRLERERKTLVISRKKFAVQVISAYKKRLLPWTEVMPDPANYCEFEPVKAILELPNDVTVDGSSFDDVIPELDSLFSKWRKDINLDIRRLLDPTQENMDGTKPSNHTSLAAAGEMPKKQPSQAELDQQIQLATTVFRCKVSSNDDMDAIYHVLYGGAHNGRSACANLFYPDVLSHRCLSRTSTYSTSYRNDESLHLERVVSSRRSWTCERLVVDEKAKALMEDIVKFCKLDPATATAKDLDDLDIWLGCPDCASWTTDTDKAKAPVYKWRAAIKHQTTNHRSRPVEWLQLSDTQAQEALAGAPGGSNGSLSIEAISPYTPPGDAVWACVHCLDRPFETEARLVDTIEQHVTLKHEIATPVVNIDYYKLVGSTEDAPTYRATFDIKRDPAKVALENRMKAFGYGSMDYYDQYDSDMEDEDDGIFGHLPSWFDSDDEYGFY